MLQQITNLPDELLLTAKQQKPMSLSIDSQLAQVVNGMGATPLLECAGAILAVITQLQFMRLDGQIPSLKQSLIEEIFNFEARAHKLQIPRQTISASRYLLCAVIDELILNHQFADNRPWERAEDWSRQSLVSHFYHEYCGGEKFFEILNFMLTDPAENLDALELILIILSLGFEGKYRIMPQGFERLALLREKLYTCIIQQHSLHPKAEASSNTLAKLMPTLSRRPIWVSGLCLLAGVVALFTYFHHQLANQAIPIIHSIQALQ